MSTLVPRPRVSQVDELNPSQSDLLDVNANVGLYGLFLYERGLVGHDLLHSRPPSGEARHRGGTRQDQRRDLPSKSFHRGPILASDSNTQLDFG